MSDAIKWTVRTANWIWTGNATADAAPVEVATQAIEEIYQQANPSESSNVLDAPKGTFYFVKHSSLSTIADKSKDEDGLFDMEPYKPVTTEHFSNLADIFEQMFFAPVTLIINERIKEEDAIVCYTPMLLANAGRYNEAEALIKACKSHGHE